MRHSSNLHVDFFPLSPLAFLPMRHKTQSQLITFPCLEKQETLLTTYLNVFRQKKNYKFCQTLSKFSYLDIFYKNVPYRIT